VTTEDITTLRLVNQGIAPASGVKTPEAVVKHMGAMQAQDYYGSVWAIGLRTNRTEKEVIRSIEAHSIVRTWPQRGTIHFVPAEDARWLVSLSADRLVRGARGRQEQLGLSQDMLAQSKVVLTRALADGRFLTRPKVMETLEAAGISTKSGIGYHILWYLSQTGVTFIGPMEGKQQTIGLLDGVAATHQSFSQHEGMAELAKRYFISHGPATMADFMWWSGLKTADAKAAVEAHASVLTSEKIEDKEYWMSKASLVAFKTGAAPTESYLLPGFDEYMLGYKDRTAALHIDHTQKIVPGGNGMFLSTIVVGGQVVGTWKRVIKKDHVLITLSPFRMLTKAELKSLQRPAEQYGRFLELPAKLA